MEASDLELLRSAGRGDHRAFHALVDRHARRLLRIAGSMAHDLADAEDICQETFVAAYRGLRNFDGRSSVKTWLTRILMKRAATAWTNRQRRERRVSTLDMAGAGALDGADGPRIARRASGGALAVEQRLDILEAIRSLPADLRDAVVLRDIDGMKYQEIADTLGVPIGTVESRIHRARLELRQKLSGY